MCHKYNVFQRRRTCLAYADSNNAGGTYESAVACGRSTPQPIVQRVDTASDLWRVDTLHGILTMGDTDAFVIS